MVSFIEQRIRRETLAGLTIYCIYLLYRFSNYNFSTSLCATSRPFTTVPFPLTLQTPQKQPPRSWRGSMPKSQCGGRIYKLNTIYCSQLSHKEWSVLNNLAGRSTHSPRPLLLSSNTIAIQLTKCGMHENRLETPDGENISGHFSPNEFAAVLHQTKPSKVQGLHYICPEFHAGSALKYSLCTFPLNCLRHHKISRRACDNKGILQYTDRIGYRILVFEQRLSEALYCVLLTSCFKSWHKCRGCLSCVHYYSQLFNAYSLLR